MRGMRVHEKEEEQRWGKLLAFGCWTAGDARGAGCDTAAAAAAGLAAGASATSCFAGRCEALGAAPVDESAPFFFGVRKRSVLDRQTDITESLEVSCFFLAVVSTNSSASMLLLNL